MEERIYSVYVLRDPDTRCTRYVGATSTSIALRLRRHLLEARHESYAWPKIRWIRELVALGKTPIAEAIAGGLTKREALELERFVAVRLTRYGFDLLNSDGGFLFETTGPIGLRRARFREARTAVTQ